MRRSMQAVLLTRYGGSLELGERPIPQLAAGEVLVRVRASGLCSTDLHLLSGRQPLGELPRILENRDFGQSRSQPSIRSLRTSSR